MQLTELLARERAAILADAERALARAHLAHYTADGRATAAARLARLYDLVADAIASRSLAAILRHASEIASERFHAGFDLAEVQIAFNVLEEAIWQRIVSQIAAADLAQAFGLLSTVLGAGKDRLATAYVELASQTKAPSLDLRRLFAGTDG